MRRDDPSPAPWTKEGKARIASLDLKPIYPDGYLEVMKKSNTSAKKRPALHDEEDTMVLKRNKSPPKKKLKREKYDLEDELKNFIENDKLNAKLWAECTTALPDGKTAFLQYISER